MTTTYVINKKQFDGINKAAQGILSAAQGLAEVLQALQETDDSSAHPVNANRGAAKSAKPSPSSSSPKKSASAGDAVRSSNGTIAPDMERGIFYARVGNDGRLKLSEKMFEFADSDEIWISKMRFTVGSSADARVKVQGSKFGAGIGETVKFVFRAATGHFNAVVMTDEIPVPATRPEQQPKRKASSAGTPTAKQPEKPKSVAKPKLTADDSAAKTAQKSPTAKFDSALGTFARDAKQNRRAGFENTNGQYVGRDIRRFLTKAQRQEFNKLSSRSGFAKDLGRAARLAYEMAFVKKA